MTTLGICVSELAILNPIDQKRVLTDIHAFGFRSVRFEVPWVAVQPRKGVWDWALVRNARDVARSLGIELLPVLGVHRQRGGGRRSTSGSSPPKPRSCSKLRRTRCGTNRTSRRS